MDVASWTWWKAIHEATFAGNRAAPMPTTLALKLILTPTLIGSSTLAGRRWGPALGGWLVGLPFTSGPVALFLVLDHGVVFGAQAAGGMLAGTISQVAFTLAYRRLAWRGAWIATAAGVAAFAACTLTLSRLTPAPAVGLAATAGAIALGLALTARANAAGPATHDLPWWDLPARMAVATGFVVAVSTAAPVLGAQLSGLLSPFPFFGATLAVFAHHRDGAAAAGAVLRGLLYGLLAPAAFFFVLATLLVPLGAVAAFAAATATALAAQAVTLAALRR